MRVTGSFWGIIFLVGIFLLIGGVFTAISAFQLKEYFDSADWLSVEGEITRLSIDEDYDSEDGTTYRANIEYRFTLDGRDYYGNRHQFGADIYSSDRGRAEAAIAVYEQGETVLVYYNSANPEANVLLREVDWLLWLFFVIGAILLLVGLAIGISALIGGIRGVAKAKPAEEELQSGDYLLNNEKFKL